MDRRDNDRVWSTSGDRCGRLDAKHLLICRNRLARGASTGHLRLSTCPGYLDMCVRRSAFKFVTEGGLTSRNILHR